jgi:cytoplasmic iron level regulating protein YaaA (DUF328/UPF0246 family)
MIILLSPAKSLDFESDFALENSSIPAFIEQADYLVKNLQKFDSKTIGKVMKISANLAELNFLRFKDFKNNHTRQALLAYDGDVYDGIDKKNYRQAEFNFAQEHLRIISGLYGILRPLDLIKPYRLEMACDFKNFDFIAKNLYQFWGDKITQYLNNLNSKTIVNLASQEYFASIDLKKINKKIIDISFKENKNGLLKNIGINAKKARGLMTNFAIVNKIKDPQHLKNFNSENYCFNTKLSNENNWVFCR